jgi:phage terminase large subunit-like protein
VEPVSEPAGRVDPGLLRRLLRMPAVARRAVLAQLSDEDRYWLTVALKHDWSLHARPEQRLPSGRWDVFVMLAGRGGGKTRPGAQNFIEWSREFPLLAMMAKDAAMVRDVMIEGDSGILACCPPWWRPKYDKTKLTLTFPNGAKAMPLTAEAGADAARGRQFYRAWAEEIAAWPHVEEAWNEGLMNAMRLGNDPRTQVTTTPKPTSFISNLCLGPKGKDGKRSVTPEQTQIGPEGYVVWEFTDVMKDGREHRTVVARWRTERNASNLAPGFAEKRRQQYGEGSRVAAQELDAEILEKVEGALWSMERLERNRVTGVPCSQKRVLVAVDPTRSDRPRDECGIVVCSLGQDGHGYVLDDRSLAASPAGWGGAVVRAVIDYRADEIVYEKNRMGAMVEDVLRPLLRAAGLTTKLIGVQATLGKVARAEPVSALDEQGLIHHVGEMPLLESELVSWDPESGYSPGRLDARVWGFTALMLGEQKPAIKPMR